MNTSNDSELLRESVLLLPERGISYVNKGSFAVSVYGIKDECQLVGKSSNNSMYLAGTASGEIDSDFSDGDWSLKVGVGYPDSFKIDLSIFRQTIKPPLVAFGLLIELWLFLTNKEIKAGEKPGDPKATKAIRAYNQAEASTDAGSADKPKESPVETVKTETGVWFKMVNFAYNAYSSANDSEVIETSRAEKEKIGIILTAKLGTNEHQQDILADKMEPEMVSLYNQPSYFLASAEDDLNKASSDFCLARYQ
jgi:hypothetical protein